jgi:two-component system CheB/CheR fusion protein
MSEFSSAEPRAAPEFSLGDVESPDSTASTRFPIAAIGASAGGLAALAKLLESIPQDSGIGFVVITHLDPARESVMPALLARHTAMPVVHAQDGQAVQANQVYVMPPVSR